MKVYSLTAYMMISKSFALEPFGLAMQDKSGSMHIADDISMEHFLPLISYCEIILYKINDHSQMCLSTNTFDSCP